jgi:mannose-6-phosphate isomerase-like protein (cupin superfamily)
MPVIKKNGPFPAWCELQVYEIIRPAAGKTLKMTNKGAKEKLMVAEGECTVAFGGDIMKAQQGDQLDIDGPGASYEVSGAEEGTVLIRLCGSWGEETGSSGFFEQHASDEPGNDGDPADYRRNTKFDRHYHDCDQYYVLYEGSGVVVIDNKAFEVAAGDCVAIGKGFHHDISMVHKPIKAVYFETTMQGRKRPGHLWNHTHGQAEPRVFTVAVCQHVWLQRWLELCIEQMPFTIGIGDLSRLN